MRRGLPWLLLVLSLALNLFFIAGALYSGALIGGETARPDPEAVAARLDLDELQHAELLALRTRTTERREAMRASRTEPRQAILDALAAPGFDRELVLAQLRTSNDGWNTYLLETYTDLHAFLSGLDADQKAAFLEMAREERRFVRDLLSEDK